VTVASAAVVLRWSASVYVDEQGLMLCELCRASQSEVALDCRLVHGPEFGHSIRIVDQRAA